MKKLSLYVLAMAAMVGMAACGSDSDDCTMEGHWTIKSADLTSDKLDSTILNMSKTQMMGTEYTFTVDSVTIKTPGQGSSFVGSYSLDELNQQLSWNTVSSGNGLPYNDNLKVKSCAGGEMTVIQRTPTDTTQPAIIQSTLVLAKSKK